MSGLTDRDKKVQTGDRNPMLEMLVKQPNQGVKYAFGCRDLGPGERVVLKTQRSFNIHFVFDKR